MYEALASTVTNAIDKVHRRHIKGGVNDDNLLCELKKQGINFPHLIVEELQNEIKIIKNTKGKYTQNKNFGQNATAITTVPIFREWVNTSECCETGDNEEEVFHSNGSRNDTREIDSEAAQNIARNENPYMLVIENLTEDIKFLRSSLDKKDIIIHDLVKSLTVIHNSNVDDLKQGKRGNEHYIRPKQQKQREEKKSVYDQIPYDYKSPNHTNQKPTNRDWEPHDDC